MIPDRNDRLPFEEPKRSFVGPLVFGAIAVAGAMAGGFIYYQRQLPPPPSKPEFADIHELLGVSIPTPLERLGVRKQLELLRREPCDNEAIAPIAAAIEKAGFIRESARSRENFFTRCRPSGKLLESAYQSYQRINDFAEASRIASKMIELDKASSHYRFLRGRAHEPLKNYNAALADYVSALSLFPNLGKVHVTHFNDVSRMYDAVGKPCEAITPLETYISFEPAARRTQQLSSMINDYTSKGNCRTTYANGTDRILIQRGNIVAVSINGVTGKFIVDTGATLVSVTPQFADRAKLAYRSDNLLTVRVVGGTVQKALSYAQTITVGNTSAKDVAVLVSVGSNNAFGDNLDGLLGMSFLARFRVTVAGRYLELGANSLSQ